MDLSVDLCGIRLSNPTILASGILGVSRSLLARVASSGAGAVTTKSISLEPRPGHPNPCVVTYEAGMLNAMGYPNPGVEAAREEFAAIEIPVSCPHTPGFGTLGGHASAQAIGRITARVRKETDLPLFVKLPPGGPEIVGTLAMETVTRAKLE